MKIYRFNPRVDREDEQLDSVKAIIAKVLQLDNNAKVNAVYLHPNERISHQQALTQQLLLVVDGEGWMMSRTNELSTIRAGQAIFWEANEIQESGTETGITAVIIEGEKIDSSKLMPPLQEDEP